jgi:hypothetical protein
VVGATLSLLPVPRHPPTTNAMTATAHHARTPPSKTATTRSAVARKSRHVCSATARGTGNARSLSAASEKNRLPTMLRCHRRRCLWLSKRSVVVVATTRETPVLNASTPAALLPPLLVPRGPLRNSLPAPSARWLLSVPLPLPRDSRTVLGTQPSSSYQGSQNQVPTLRPANGQPQQKQYQASSAAPKPLNVAKPAVNDAVKKAEQALTSKPKEETPRKDVRMSSMSESEVMAKLREVVSKDKPLESYNKQKKIGQGASGSVYVARIREGATSAMARRILQENGPRAQVAIKQMDLRNQPRKELIVNEIIVMKDSKHPNIVNFLDAFLQEEQSELWVVMEFMEGGALTDVIDNNPTITEDQIATICFEVSLFQVRLDTANSR